MTATVPQTFLPLTSISQQTNFPNNNGTMLHLRPLLPAFRQYQLFLSDSFWLTRRITSLLADQDGTLLYCTVLNCEGEWLWFLSGCVWLPLAQVAMMRCAGHNADGTLSLAYKWSPASRAGWEHLMRTIWEQNCHGGGGGGEGGVVCGSKDEACLGISGWLWHFRRG